MILNDAFEWRQTSSGLALVCRALEPFAPHLFTTREWPLGSPRDDDREQAWGDVARALGVDHAQLTRAHQVHGAGVVVRRAENGVVDAAPLPQADILLSD